MRFSEIIKSALASIWSMKVRSFLTSLGVIIGVFAIASLLSIGESAIGQIQQSIEDLNTSVIISEVYDEHEQITIEDLDALSGEPGISTLAPVMQSGAAVENGLSNMYVDVIGTTSEYAKIHDTELLEGRFIMPLDAEVKNNSAVLGFTVAMKLFGNTDVIGEYFFVDNHRFAVAGVMDKKAETWQGNPNEQVLIPYTTGQKLFDMGDITSISALPAADEQMEQAMASIRSFYSEKRDGSTEGFYVYTAAEMQQTIEEMNTTLMALLGGIGAISLLISGIGIMNIMLVSVRERTREIGIRKAIGARRRDILIQFLIEAVVLSGIGGLIGIALTFGLAEPIGSLMQSPVSPSLTVVLISLVFSLVIGVIFGLYPAAKASKMNPIEALRYE